MVLEPKHHKIKGKRQLNGVTHYQLEYNSETFKDAGCAGLDTALFYPDKVVFNLEEQRFYKNLCSHCPIVEACLEWGLAHESYGVWGGLTPALRTEYRKVLKWGVTDLTGSGYTVVH